MKQKDVILIVLIAFVSAIVSYTASHFIFATPKNRQQAVAIVDPVSTQFSTPNPKFYNSQSIDPTKLIEVGGNNNQNPFNGSGQ